MGMALHATTWHLMPCPLKNHRFKFTDSILIQRAAELINNQFVHREFIVTSNHFSSSYTSILFRAILLGLVLFGLMLPVGAHAGQQLDPTVTPSAIITPSSIPVAQETPTPQAAYDWLSSPPGASDLASDRSLAILAGRLIFNGLVDASSCPDGGMLENGAASPCGEIIARDAVIVWQNQFDAEIFKVATENNIPPFILKQIFIKESQFWPATYMNPTYGGEYGLGHVTLMGADTLLSWNRSFYKTLCNENFNEETCKKEYVFQDASIKNSLQGLVVTSMNADCAYCVGGVNLEKARNSISITAAMLIANRNHVQWLIRGISSASLTERNTWRYAIASYNAGPGCITKAVYNSRTLGSPLEWKNVSRSLLKECEHAVEYVDFVADIDAADPVALVIASNSTSLAARIVLGPLPTATTTALSPETSILEILPITEPVISPSTTPVETETASTPTELSDPVTEVASPTVTFTATPVPTETATPTAIPSALIQPTTSVPPAGGSTGEIVIKFNGLVPDFLAEAAIGSAGGETQSQLDELGLTVVSAPVDQIPQVLESLQNNLLVDYAEPNYSVQALYTPDDPDYVNQTYLSDMQIQQTWDVSQGDGVIVAVIDTGVDVMHPDLTSNIWVNPGEDGQDVNGFDKRSNLVDDDQDGYIDNWMGWNFVEDNNDARDANGHGTHLAGIIAAQMDNTLGIAGVAPKARIMAVKALDNSGFGTYAQVAEAIIYAVDHGAKVINLGFGGTANSEALLAATDYAYSHNVIVIAAGGNTGTQTLIYPAANPHVISVSALDKDLNVATFSSSSAAIQISAPGVGIYSTMPNSGYASMSGTSMASAQVSGVVSLLAARPQFDTVDKLREALINSALDLGDTGSDIYFGYGLVHAFDALGYGTTLPTATAPVQPTPTMIPATPDASADGGVTSMAQEVFWAQAQTCATLTTGANSVITPYSFDNNVAQCTNTFAENNGWLFSEFWRPTGIATTSYTSIYSATLDMAFYMTGLGDDEYAIQFSPDNGTSWYSLETFDTTNLPPASLERRNYNVSTITSVISNAVDTPAEVNDFRMRIWGITRNGGANNVSIYVDQVSLIVVQNTAPTISINSPGSGTSYVQGRVVSFTATANDTEEGNLTGVITWKEGATTLGTGGSLNISTLGLGSHTITASVTDVNGLTTSVSITISIVVNTAPTVNITAPIDNAVIDHGVSTTFSATASDSQDGNIASNVTWTSNIDGPLGTGASFSTDHLTSGTHLISAQVTDLDGATGTATITVVVVTNDSLHGNFDFSTDTCAACHRDHSAQSNGGDLLNSPTSAYSSNDFCLSCHNSGSNAVSTHSNIDVNGNKEADFELLCVQCHDPHGSSNLFAIRGEMHLGTLPTSFINMTNTTGPVVLSALTGTNSFDEADVPEDAANNADDVCVSCHVNVNNPGVPMVAHAGGEFHLGGNNYTGQSCIYCHPHNADNSSLTKDGFMPIRGSCVGCHSQAQGSRRAIVGVSGDFTRTSHHANTSVTDVDCILCHDQSQHMNGTVRLLNVDNTSLVYTLDGTNDPVDYEAFCLSCHDSNGAKGDTSPFSDNVNMVGTSLQMNAASWSAASHNGTKTGFSGSCVDCHDNGHGSNKANMLSPWNYVNAGTPTDDPLQQEEYFCYSCHKSGGVAVTDIMTNYTRTTRWVQAATGENNLTTLNDRHDISIVDQTTGAIHSGAKIECVSCHNPHVDNSTRKVIADPDPSDGRVPGSGYFTQGNTADFFTDWCLDCHDGSYPAGVTPPTNALVNIYSSMSVNTHGSGSGNVGSLESGFGYSTNTIVQCRQCHGTHVQAPTPVNSQSNLFSLLLRVRNFNNTADVPTDPPPANSFSYEVTSINVSTSDINGYNWCQTCHVSSMGSNKTNCFACHYHGASGDW